jgi:uncharacterized repeat protein (TIGR01451 family)
MNDNRNLPSTRKVTRALSKLILMAAPAVIVSVTATAQAQTALAGSDLIMPQSVAPGADMVNLKTAVVGGQDRFSILITNTGQIAVNGAAVTDTVATGGNCPRNNAVTIAGNGIPDGKFTVNNLAAPGIALGILQPGQSATLTYSCQVN